MLSEEHFDGLIPLGPDFIQMVLSRFNNMSPQELEQNQSFQGVKDEIPGGSSSGKLGFINESFSSVSGWMSGFVNSRGLTPQNVAQNLSNIIDFSEDKLDYLGAFLDVSTNYYEHTGVQTLARRLIERAAAEI